MCQFRRHGFNPWAGKIPQTSEQLNLCVQRHHWACALEPALRKERRFAPQRGRSPAHCQREKARPAMKTPRSQRLQEQQKMNTALCLDLALGVLKRRLKQHPPGPVPVRHEALRALHKGKALGTAGVHGDRARSILKIFGEY